MSALDEIRQAEREVDAARWDLEKTVAEAMRVWKGTPPLLDAYNALQAKRAALRAAEARRNEDDHIHAQRQPAPERPAVAEAAL